MTKEECEEYLNIPNIPYHYWRDIVTNESNPKE